MMNSFVSVGGSSPLTSTVKSRHRSLLALAEGMERVRL
jgi:hypothetical protein